MRINKLALTNFRSYNSLELDLEPGVITFVGDNGSGKTTILNLLVHILSPEPYAGHRTAIGETHF